MGRQTSLRGRDLVAIIWAGRWMFVVVFVFTVAAILATLGVLPSVYYSKGQVEVGKIKQQYLERPSEVVSRMDSLGIPGIGVVERRQGVVEFHARGRTAEASREALREALGRLLRDHEVLAEAQDRYYRDLLDHLDAESQSIQKRLAELATSSDPQSLVKAAEARIRLVLAELRVRRTQVDLERRLEVQPTRLVSPATRLEDLPLPVRPARPRKAHYLAALALGLIFAVVASFLAGYLSWIKRASARDANE